jgi:hypothetical protein
MQRRALRGLRDGGGRCPRLRTALGLLLPLLWRLVPPLLQLHYLLLLLGRLLLGRPVERRFAHAGRVRAPCGLPRR